jgi:hypothetical protein
VLELDELLVGARSAHGFGDVEAGERADAVAAFRIAEGLVVGELGVGVRLDCFADNLAEAVGVDAVFDDVAPGVNKAESAVSELNRLVFIDEAEVVGREVGEDFDFRLEGIGDLLVGRQREADVGISLREHGQDFVTLGGCEGLGNAAGNNPAGMDALVAEQLNDVLTEPTESNAGAAELRFGGDDAEDVAGGGVGFHTQKEVGRGEIKEAEGVGLDHLGEIQHATQLGGGMRNFDRHDGLASLGGRNEVRDGADAADAGHEGGHFVKGAALREALKATNLRDVEMRVFDFALAVELDSDFAVAFEACNGIDGDGLCHRKLRVPLRGAGEDAHTTAGLETGATFDQRCIRLALHSTGAAFGWRCIRLALHSTGAALRLQNG